MADSSSAPSGSLSHAQIQSIIQALGDAKVLNLDTSIRSIMEPVAAVLRETPGATVSLHVVCCNEYGLVTGVQAASQVLQP
jgi:hypothetical protein